VIGTAPDYAPHDEGRYHNKRNGARIGLRSQVHVMQLQAGHTGVQTGQVRRASISVAKSFDILGGSNLPGSNPANPASITS
jgi:hypothetical protein